MPIPLNLGLLCGPCVICLGNTLHTGNLVGCIVNCCICSHSITSFLKSQEAPEGASGLNGGR
nr:MAG TPA: hypothetical protein [Microviridae sp.]